MKFQRKTKEGLYDIGLGSNLGGMTPKAQTTKVKNR